MSTLVFNSYASLDWMLGGTLTSATATGFSYNAANGTSMTVTGKGLTYADGVPVGGTITAMTMGLGVPVMAWSGLSVSAASFTALAFTTPDAIALERLMMAGNDLIDGGPGNGMIHGRAGNDTLHGGSDDDWLFGDEGRDRYYGDDGTDGVTFRTDAIGGHGIRLELTRATGQVRDDGFGNIETATDVERWEGSVWNDAMTGGAASDTFWGAEGDDTLRGGGESDWLYGNAGNDKLFGDAGVDFLNGGRGVDYYNGGADGDIVSLWIDEGNDSGARLDLRLARGNILDDGFGNVETAINVENFEGTEQGDWMHAGDVATAQPVVLHGRGGEDTLEGGAASSVLDGGEGNDLLLGGAGDESLSGGAGVDTLDGGAGRDMLDLFLSTFGLEKGVKINLSLASGQIIDDGFGNTETATGFEILSLSEQADDATGSALGDMVYGNGGADVLRGLGGDDFLYGASGNDTILGGAGNDWLQGGSGANRLTGGAGADRFALEATGDAQVITDFVAGVDYLILDSDWVDLGSLGSLGAAQFALGTAATTADQRVIYDQASGQLWVDADGNGASEALLVARLTNHAALTIADIGISGV